MLEITIPDTELFDESNNTFINVPETTLRLEHSLVSIKKWEEVWHKPFLSNSNDRTREELIDYIRCMTISQNVKPEVYLAITDQILIEIDKYINDPRTATWFSDSSTTQGGSKRGINNSIITAELVYYWMITFNIPVEFQKWHFNSLMTLIKVCDEKNKESNKDGKKMSQNDIIRRNKALNEARRKKYNSKG